jgi:hypothetical protein
MDLFIYTIKPLMKYSEIWYDKFVHNANSPFWISGLLTYPGVWISNDSPDVVTWDISKFHHKITSRFP